MSLFEVGRAYDFVINGCCEYIKVVKKTNARMEFVFTRQETYKICIGRIKRDSDCNEISMAMGGRIQSNKSVDAEEVELDRVKPTITWETISTNPLPVNSQQFVIDELQNIERVRRWFPNHPKFRSHIVNSKNEITRSLVKANSLPPIYDEMNRIIDLQRMIIKDKKTWYSMWRNFF